MPTAVSTYGLWSPAGKRFPYKSQGLVRVRCLYHTEHNVTIEVDGKKRSVSQDRVWPLRKEHEAEAPVALAEHDAFAKALLDVEEHLNRLQPYMKRRDAIGPFRPDMPLLCSYVIEAEPPEKPWGVVVPWALPRVTRVRLFKHHPERLTIEDRNYPAVGAKNKFYCPDDDAEPLEARLPRWADVERAYEEAKRLLAVLVARLERYGTYAQATGTTRPG